MGGALDKALEKALEEALKGAVEEASEATAAVEEALEATTAVEEALEEALDSPPRNLQFRDCKITADFSAVRGFKDLPWNITFCM